MADLLALSDEEFGRMLPDLFAWFVWCKELHSMDGVEVQSFDWIDDGRAGELHSVEMAIKGTDEKQVIEGSAFGPTD